MNIKNLAFKSHALCLLFLFINCFLYSQNMVSSIQMKMDSIYQEHPSSIGLMVHIEYPNKNISHTFTTGYSSKDKIDTLEADDIFLIASNVKTYVSAAILRLIEMKQLKLSNSIKDIISPLSREILEADGYNLDVINIQHLLSHTSGIADYVGESYMKFILENKEHRWTRNEQIALSTEVGDPLGQPGEVFQYADVNFLLLSEVIETKTRAPFYKAIRDLLEYEKLALNNTWFYTLEDKPNGSGDMVHQYWTSKDLDSWDIDASFDLYGAGGIASTAEELCSFSQHLFGKNIIRDTSILNLIYKPAITTDGKDHHYHLGLQSSTIDEYQLYGHGGFWGTVVQYIPEINASISIVVLERDKRILRKDLLEAIIPILE